MQLENLPGYEIGEVPSHLLKLKVELEKTFESLEKKNELKTIIGGIREVQAGDEKINSLHSDDEDAYPEGVGIVEK